MATLTPKLTLTGTATDFGSALNLAVSSSLTVGEPTQGLSRKTITTADDQELVATAGGVKYFYAKNLDSTNFVILQTVASQQYARLSPGEFCFFPINDGNGLEARADTASCILEFAFFTKA